MSYKYHTANVEGVRKVKWDGLWHVMYSTGTKPYHMEDTYSNKTYDRVTKKEAMQVLKMIPKWQLAHTKHALTLNSI